jgi:hypothetical protein
MTKQVPTIGPPVTGGEARLPAKGGKAPAKADRLAREAAALRANLRKRKDQAHRRAEPAGTPNKARPAGGCHP